MKKKVPDHAYLLWLYSKVSKYLGETKEDNENIGDIIVSFCIVVEKIIKIKLHKKNPVLVFDVNRAKDSSVLQAIVDKKEDSIETIKIDEALVRLQLSFPKMFTSDEIQALTDIFRIRNNFIHGYKSDAKIAYDKEDILKKIGTIWEKVSKQAVTLFGKDDIRSSQPRQKYTEEELEKVLLTEVKAKIANKRRGELNIHEFMDYTLDDYSLYGDSSSKCPRCGSYGFKQDSPMWDFASIRSYIADPSILGGIYKCPKCHLELTNKEFEISKKI